MTGNSGYQAVKEFWLYVYPFWQNTEVSRTDRWTNERQNAIAIARCIYEWMQTRNKQL